MAQQTGPAYPSESKELQLAYTSNDPISCVEFCPGSSKFLLVTCWDNSVSLMHVPTNTLRTKYMHNAPVIDACFQDVSTAYTGGVDRTLKRYDFNVDMGSRIGCHDETIRCVEYCPGLDSILTGSWDKTVKMWDPRTYRSIGTFNQPDKVYALASCGDKFIVGTRQRKICIWDLRNNSCILQRRESSLKYQTRYIKSFPDNKRFVLSSIEGRVAVEYLDLRPEVQKRKYAFKCHRLRENGIEQIYSVNSISFHGQHKTFATGGGDGFVNMWDSGNKKRLCQFHRYPTGVSSIAFSNDGSVLAIACSYCYDEPVPARIPPSEIFLRYVTDLETKPK